MTVEFKKYLAECTDSRTMKIIHLKKELPCCLRCTTRQRRTWYGKITGSKSPTKYPSWKLVSKNEKQWMKKDIKIETKQSRCDWTYTEITW